MTPLAAAHRATLAAVCLSVALAIALVPRIAPLEVLMEAWRQAMWVGAAAFAVLAMGWAHLTMRPTVSLPADSAARRRLAHDFPFRLARLTFVGALVAGVASAAWLWPKTPPSTAIVTGAITYLLMLLPVMPVYLIVRRALRPDAAGPPGAPPVRALRQGVALRLVFAVQLPVVVCAVGIVMVEEDDQSRYHADLEAFYRTNYAAVANRTLDMLPPEARAKALGTLPVRSGVQVVDGRLQAEPGPGDTRPMEMRLPPFILLALVLLLSARLGRWLAVEVTAELKQVRGTLAMGAAQPSQQADAPLETPVGIRETHELMGALNLALSGFRARRRAMAQAAEGRRQAELAKSRFLAHLSHELKSPLNSILGFAEVLLCEIDGPLDARQRDRLAIVWRSGDSLFRFILVLLDLAQLETGTRTDLDQRQVDVTALVDAIEQNQRIDPTGELRISLVNEAAAQAHIDPAWVARTLLYLAGLLQESMESGVVRLTFSGASALVCRIDSSQQTAAADGEDLHRLRSELLGVGAALDRGATIPAIMDDQVVRQRVLVTINLARWVVEANGGVLEVEDGEWPAFTVCFPAVG